MIYLFTYYMNNLWSYCTSSIYPSIHIHLKLVVDDNVVFTASAVNG